MAVAGTTMSGSAILPPKGVAILYMTFLIASAGVSYFIAEMNISVLLTLGAMAQCLAIALLWIGSQGSGGVSGISAHSLILYVLSLSLRLSSSTWLNGYLPVDASGDGLFQTVDVITLVVSVVLLYRVACAQYERLAEGPAVQNKLQFLMSSAIGDTLTYSIPITFALASMVHADMNSRPFYDMLWTAGHFLSAASSLPQLRVCTRNTDAGSEYVQHSLLAAALGQLLVLVYMWLCRQDLICQEWIEGVNHAAWFILAAPLAHLAIICDVVPQIFSTDVV